MTMTAAKQANGNGTAATPTASVGLVLARDDASRRALEPANLNDGMRLAAVVAVSGMFGVRTEGEALVRMGTGASLGLSVWHALRAIYTVEGRPSLAAALKMALCLSSPSCEYFRCVETTDERAVYVTKRKGNPEQRYAYTIEDARKAGLVDRGKDPKENNWHKYRAFMLRARASGALADLEFPDVTLGLETYEGQEDARIVVGPGGEPMAQVQEQAPAKAMQATVAVVADFSAELASIKASIEAAKTKDDAKAIRGRIEQWTAPPMYLAEAKEAYNAKFARKAKAAEAAPPPPPSPPPAPPKEEPKAVMDPDAPTPEELAAIDRGDNPDAY